MKAKLPGLNIQFPISSLIVSGEKTVETRTYPMPTSYIGKEILIVETPGKRGFKARVTAIAVFGPSFLYKSKAEFYRDFPRHRVDKNSKWAWAEKPKWGWPVLSVKKIPKPIEVLAPIGIRFTKEVRLKNA